MPFPNERTHASSSNIAAARACYAQHGRGPRSVDRSGSPARP
jgi:hypothetical protein